MSCLHNSAHEASSRGCRYARDPAFRCGRGCRRCCVRRRRGLATTDPAGPGNRGRAAGHASDPVLSGAAGEHAGRACAGSALRVPRLRGGHEGLRPRHDAAVRDSDPFRRPPHGRARRARESTADIHGRQVRSPAIRSVYGLFVVHDHRQQHFSHRPALSRPREGEPRQQRAEPLRTRHRDHRRSGRAARPKHPHRRKRVRRVAGQPA